MGPDGQDGDGGHDGAAEASARPDVLGYPSPTTARYLIFVTALLASGLFVGNWVHSEVAGERWRRDVATCALQPGAGDTLDQAVARNAQLQRCTAEPERARALVTASGALVTGGAALALMYLLPPVVARRRRLRPLPAALAGAGQRFDELAREAGVAGRTSLRLGPATQRDAFSFGSPGRLLVALPPAAVVRFRDASTFDPLVRHELAHVAHRDVTLAWLTRLVWVVLIPVLAVPLLVDLVTGDWDRVGAYAWRVLLLGAVVALLSSDLLRAREHRADLRAARWGQTVDPVLALLRRAQGPDRSTLARRILAKHPTAEERAEVVLRPGLVTTSGFEDGLTGAFLVALTTPLLVSLLSPMLSGAGRSDWSYLIAAALLGPLLAGSVGLGLWKAALFARLSGRSAPVLPIAVGVGLGLVLGQAVSLSTVNNTLEARVGSWWWLLLSAPAGAGAVVVAAGLGHLWADASPRLPGVRQAWWSALGVCSVVFTTLLWSTTLFQDSVATAGWVLGRLMVTTVLAPWWVFWLVALLLASALWPLLAGRRSREIAPGWLVEGADPVAWPAEPRARLREALVPGLVAAAAGTATVVTFRILAGAARDDAESLQRFEAYQWVAGLAAAATALVLVAVRPHRGGGLGLLAGSVAVVGVLGGYLVLNSALGGSLDGALAAGFLRPGLVLGFYLTLLLAPAASVAAWLLGQGRTPALADGRAERVRGRRLVLAGAVVVVAVTLGSGALAVRGSLVGSAIPTDLVTGADPGTRDDDAVAAELALYLTEVVPAVTGEYDAVASLAQQIWQDAATDDVTKAARTQTEVLPRIATLRELATQYPVLSADVGAVHSELVAALRTAEERYRLLATGTVDQPTLDRLQELAALEARHWSAWSSAREELAARAAG